jgi:hypothetical protein
MNVSIWFLVRKLAVVPAVVVLTSVFGKSFSAIRLNGLKQRLVVHLAHLLGVTVPTGRVLSTTSPLGLRVGDIIWVAIIARNNRHRLWVTVFLHD